MASKKIKGYFYAYNKRDVEYFLESEELEVVSVKTSKSIQMLNRGFRRNRKLQKISRNTACIIKSKKLK